MHVGLNQSTRALNWHLIHSGKGRDVRGRRGGGGAGKLKTRREGVGPKWVSTGALIRILFPSPAGYEVAVGIMWV